MSQQMRGEAPRSHLRLPYTPHIGRRLYPMNYRHKKPFNASSLSESPPNRRRNKRGIPHKAFPGNARSSFSSLEANGRNYARKFNHHASNFNMPRPSFKIMDQQSVLSHQLNNLKVTNTPPFMSHLPPMSYEAYESQGIRLGRPLVNYKPLPIVNNSSTVAITNVRQTSDTETAQDEGSIRKIHSTPNRTKDDITGNDKSVDQNSRYRETQDYYNDKYECKASKVSFEDSRTSKECIDSYTDACNPSNCSSDFEDEGERSRCSSCDICCSSLTSLNSCFISPPLKDASPSEYKTYNSITTKTTASSVYTSDTSMYQSPGDTLLALVNKNVHTKKRTPGKPDVGKQLDRTADLLSSCTDNTIEETVSLILYHKIKILLNEC